MTRISEERLIGIEGGLTFIGPNLGPLYEDLLLAIRELQERRGQDALLPATSDSCPCAHTTPCHKDCTCVSPLSSSGCRRCCAYGSDEQQRAMAERLVVIEDVAKEAMRRHRAGDFVRTMPTSGHALISALDRLLGEKP